MKTPSPKEDQQDREFLDGLAKYLSQLVYWPRPLQKCSVRCEATDTQGWSAHLARARIGGTSVFFDLWLDRWTHSGKRRLWFGYAWNNLRAFDRALGNQISLIPKSHWRETVDTVYDREAKLCRLRSAIPIERLPLVLVERYRSPSGCYLGAFLKPGVRKSAILTRVQTTLHEVPLYGDGALHLTERLFVKPTNRQPSPRPPRTPPLPGGDDLDDLKTPKRRQTEGDRIIRDSKVSRRLKQQYDYKCQVCGEAIRLPNGGRYAEAHHLRPVGGRHEGRNGAPNTIVVCPQHHALFDLGVIGINPATMKVEHWDPKAREHGRKVILKSSHRLDTDCLKYQYRKIFRPATIRVTQW